MLSGRSQSSWIQPSALNSQLASSNHFFVGKKPPKSQPYTQENLFSSKYIFCSLSFYQIIDFQSCEHSGTHSSSTLAETQIQKGC